MNKCLRCGQLHNARGDVCQACAKTPEPAEALATVILFAEYHIAGIDNKTWSKDAMQHVIVARKILEALKNGRAANNAN